MQLSIRIDFYQHTYTLLIFTLLLTINSNQFISLNAQTTRLIRMKENTPTGTVIIPNVINFLHGRSYTSTEHYDNDQDKTKDYLLAIGNSVMQGANWFAIDDIKKSLYVKIPPDRDILCPNEQKLPETAVSIAHGGVEFPEYNLNPTTNYNVQITNNNNNINNNDCLIKLSIIHGSSANPSFDLITVILEDVNDHAPSFKEIQSNLDSKTNEFIISVPETPTIIDKKDESSSTKHRTDYRPVRILLPTAVDPDQGVNSIRGYRLEGEDAFHFRLEVGPLIDSDLSYRVHKEFQQVGLFQDHKTNRLWLVPVRNGGGAAADATNGVELDKEHRSEYHFVLVAYDGGSPARMGKLPIRLLIEDVNDHSPEFNQEFYTGRMSENDPGGQILFEFSARDRDNTKENGLVKFRIPGQADYNPNDANSIIGQRDSRISLTESQLIAAELFSVEFPIEKSTNDLLSTQENFHNSTVYGRLIIKRQPKEKIQQAASKAITIARQNQLVNSAKLGLNFAPQHPIHTNELSSNHGDQLQFFIEAYDNGVTSLVTKVPVIILITDVNDHPPQIFISYLKPTRPLTPVNSYTTDRRQIWGKIVENLDRSMIAQVTVTDKDSTLTQSDVICKTNDSRFSLEELTNSLDRPDDLTSSIWPRNNLYTSNNIDPKSHYQNKPLTKMYKLMSITSLDREFSDKQPSFLKFSIICIDNQHDELPGGSLTSQADIFLEIDDVNDNPPVFDHNEYTFHLPENYPKLKSEHTMNPLEIDRYPIGMVHANDKDGGIHGSVEYKLVSNPSGSIQIDRFNGMINATQPFDRETINELTFQVIAIDCTAVNGTNERQCDMSMRLTGTTNVRIIIDDLNDSPPIFQEANYHFEVEEGVDLVKVGQVWAIDADQDESARISYRLAVGMSNRFKESIKDGNFVEQITKSSTTTNNNNNNNQNLYDEALEITTHFQIDPRSGLIHLKGRLDRERRAHYEFVVLALDNPRSIPTKIAGYQRQATSEVIQYTATTTVLITVLDHNDNAPRILSPLNHVEFMLSPDQLIAGNTIFTIRATDPDLGENGTIEYRLLHVEDDLGSWNVGESFQRSNQAINHANTTDTNLPISQDSKSPPNDKELIDNYPFAVDRTAGICYLRENLPPLNVDGPRAYMLRILAYDLGRPDSLNTTLIVRVARQINSVGDISNGLVYSNRMNAKEYRQTGRMDTHQHLFASLSNNEHDSTLDSKVGGTWTSAGQARISDKTMVVILSTVFVLLLLTTIVLLLLVRYRRLLIRTIPLEQSLACDAPDSKANEGFAAGKPLSPNQNNLNGFNGFFTEAILDAVDLVQRAEMVLQNAEQLNCRVFVRPEDIVSGSQKLNLAFLANLFHGYPALEKQPEEVEEKVAAIEETREEKTYRNWINSLSLKHHVNYLFYDLIDGLIFLQLFDSIQPNIVDWNEVHEPICETPAKANFQCLENCNYVIRLGRQFGFSLVGVGGADLHDGKRTMTLALLWQLMRAYTLSLLTQLTEAEYAVTGKSTTHHNHHHNTQHNGNGVFYPIEETRIIQWANQKLDKAGKFSKISTMSGFTDPNLKTSHAVIDLIESIRPNTVDYSLVLPGNTKTEQLTNAEYAITLARRIGATVYAMPEDLIELKHKMIMTIFACLMAVDLKQQHCQTKNSWKQVEHKLEIIENTSIHNSTHSSSESLEAKSYLRIDMNCKEEQEDNLESTDDNHNAEGTVESNDITKKPSLKPILLLRDTIPRPPPEKMFVKSFRINLSSCHRSPITSLDDAKQTCSPSKDCADVDSLDGLVTANLVKVTNKRTTIPQPNRSRSPIKHHSMNYYCMKKSSSSRSWSPVDLPPVNTSNKTCSNCINQLSKSTSSIHQVGQVDHPPKSFSPILSNNHKQTLHSSEQNSHEITKSNTTGNCELHFTSEKEYTDEKTIHSTLYTLVYPKEHFIDLKPLKYKCSLSNTTMKTMPITATNTTTTTTTTNNRPHGGGRLFLATGARKDLFI
ncbi:unnamed protein product [Schistosoma turkestanicum]|nr:unnamed protein product [Schistosoma turkestanicum]